MRISKQNMTTLLREMFGGDRNVQPFYNGWLIWAPRDGRIACTFCSNDEVGMMMAGGLGA